MKAIKSIALYLLTSLAPCVICYLVLDGLAFKVILVPFLIIWGLIYSYLDKALLMYLNAREVIDTDEQLLYQNVKNESYKCFEKLPKVYLYSGQKNNCFVLESRNEWAIVIERNLLAKLNQDELESVVKYLYTVKKSGITWYQTKIMGLSTITYNSIYFILSNLLFLKPNMKIFRVLSIFLISMTRPMLMPLEFLARKKKLFPADQNLKPIYYQLDEISYTFNEYILGHLLPEQDIRSLVIDYLESFPILENCRFSENEV